MCVIVAAVCLNQFVFSTKVTYIKDADNHKVQKAYDLLANAYLDDGEKTEVYYTDFIKTNKVVPVSSDGKTLLLGVVTPLRPDVLKEIITLRKRKTQMTPRLKLLKNMIQTWWN